VLDPGHEGTRQSLIVPKLEDMIDAMTASHVYGAIGAAIIDDKPLDSIEPCN
jgi:hypothetical protein